MDHDTALQMELQHLGGGLWLSDYVRLTQLNLRASFKYVICILHGLHSYLKLIIQEAQSCDIQARFLVACAAKKR